MKLRMLFVLFVGCAVLICKKNESDRCVVLDDILLMENIEALAVNEMFGAGNKKVVSAVTEYLENGVAYKCRANVECEEGGNKDCKAGVYIKEKKDNDQWSSWIKIA